MTTLTPTLAKTFTGKNNPGFYAGTDFDIIWLGAGEVKYAYTYTFAVVAGTEIYFDISRYLQATNPRLSGNIDNNIPQCGFYLAVTTAGTFDMQYYGVVDMHASLGDLSVQATVTLSTSVVITVTMRHNADQGAMNQPILPSERYSETSSGDGADFGFRQFSPSAYKQSGARYMVSYMYAIDPATGNEWTGNYALRVYGNVVSEQYCTSDLLNMNGSYNDSVTSGEVLYLYPGLTNTLTARLDVANVPCGAGSAADITGRRSVVVYVKPSTEDATPYVLHEYSEAVYDGSGTETNNRISSEAWSVGTIALSAGLLGWDGNCTFDYSLTGINDGDQIFVLQNVCLHHKTTWEVYCQRQIYFQCVVVADPTERDTILSDFVAGNTNQAINARLLSNALLNTTFYTQPGVAADALIDQTANAPAFDRYVLSSYIDDGKLLSLNIYGDTDEAWRRRFIGLTAKVYHKFDGGVLEQYNGFTAKLDWPSGIWPPRVSPSKRNVEVFFPNTDTSVFVNYIFEPLPVTKYGQSVPYIPGSRISGIECTESDWNNYCAANNIKYGLTDLEYTIIEVTFDFAVSDGETFRVLFYFATLTHPTVSAIARTATTPGRRTTTAAMTNYTYPDDFLTGRGIVADTLDYVTQLRFSGVTPLAGTKLMVGAVNSGGIVTRNQYATGLVDIEYKSASYDLMNESATDISFASGAVTMTPKEVATDEPTNIFLCLQ